ncbi:MAG: glycosyltransferase [Pelosinus sp.]|nr:glycosyltransferase [Pelosinus sp.]
MNTSRPLVSVCIPVYNGAAVIADTIHSLLTQTYNNIEFIVVDNASTDNTVEVVTSIAKDQMKIIKNETNIGAADNWNKCLEVAQGDFIAIYHADDLYEPTIVEKSVAVLSGDNEIGAVFTAANKVDNNLNKIGEINIQKGLSPLMKYGLSDIVKNVLVFRTNPFVCPSFMMRKSVYKQIGGFNAIDFKYIFDFDYYIRISEVTNVVFLSERLMNYRISTGQTTYKIKTQNTEPDEFLKIMDRYVKTNYIDSVNIDLQYLKQYECRHDIDKHKRAVRLLHQHRISEALVLFKSSLTVNRLKVAFKKFSVFRDLIYTIIFLLAIKAGLGEQLADIAYKINIRNFKN